MFTALLMLSRSCSRRSSQAVLILTLILMINREESAVASSSTDEDVTSLARSYSHSRVLTSLLVFAIQTLVETVFIWEN